MDSDRVTTQPAPAKVYLVGAGPGDPELLTLKVHRLISRAAVILHDDLVPPAILALAGPDAEVVNVGKRFGAQGVTQSEINERMIAIALRGLEVVRLKGGDPGIFGRLAEEIDYIQSRAAEHDVIAFVSRTSRLPAPSLVIIQRQMLILQDEPGARLRMSFVVDAASHIMHNRCQAE